MLPFTYVSLCLVLAYFGRHRRMGFWGMFFGSIVLTPLIGFLIWLLTDDVKQEA
jgi:uncharacterized membrane protein